MHVLTKQLGVLFRIPSSLLVGSPTIWIPSSINILMCSSSSQRFKNRRTYSCGHPISLMSPSLISISGRILGQCEQAIGVVFLEPVSSRHQLVVSSSQIFYRTLTKTGHRSDLIVRKLCQFDRYTSGAQLAHLQMLLPSNVVSCAP
ncbi:uncharacterized protein LOC124338352 [Daphnia pulicaria]|uniref:uncharacterized protein LOC124338352 n=1 Tax=Daphnia pulicaria TaxID=35523 RepID=UPI001EEAED49|nr:uncharacterized protein LOC124338352 [Daphnia pulicaria]